MSTIIYSLIRQEWAIQVFLKIGIVCLVFSVLYLFYTMLILIYSIEWAKQDRLFMIGFFILAIIISVIMTIGNFVEIEVLFDTILFGLLSGASILFAISFLRGNK